MDHTKLFGISMQQKKLQFLEQRANTFVSRIDNDKIINIETWEKVGDRQGHGNMGGDIVGMGNMGIQPHYHHDIRE